MRVEYHLDVLKPHQPSIDMLARTLEKLDGVKMVEIRVEEIDQKTTSITIVIAGSGAISIEEITETLEANNCALHSVDKVLIENWK
ncbi:MAG: DUF211 domain-containing protein [Promethearchaeota archaeon]